MGFAVGKKKVVILSIVGIVVVASIVGAYFAGFLVLRLKAPSDIATVYTPVCKSEMIDKYVVDLGSNPLELQQNFIKKTQQEIQLLDGWQKDSSCVYLMAQFSAAQRNVEETDRLVKMYESLSSEGLNPDIRLTLIGYRPSDLRAAAARPVYDQSQQGGI